MDMEKSHKKSFRISMERKFFYRHPKLDRPIFAQNTKRLFGEIQASEDAKSGYYRGGGQKFKITKSRKNDQKILKKFFFRHFYFQITYKVHESNI